MNTRPTPKRYLSNFTLPVLLAATFGGALCAWSYETPPDLSALRAESHAIRAQSAAPLSAPPQTDRIKYPPLAMARDPFVGGTKADSIPQSKGN